jgi:transposase
LRKTKLGRIPKLSLARFYRIGKIKVRQVCPNRFFCQGGVFMSKAYPVKLRQRDMEDIDKGMTEDAVAAKYKVSSATIANWKKKRKRYRLFCSARYAWKSRTKTSSQKLSGTSLETRQRALRENIRYKKTNVLSNRLDNDQHTFENVAKKSIPIFEQKSFYLIFTFAVVLI